MDSCAIRGSCPATSIPGLSTKNIEPKANEEVYPHKEIALASAAIAALHGEHERTFGLLAKGAAEPSKWREQRASLRRSAAPGSRGWRR